MRIVKMNLQTTGQTEGTGMDGQIYQDTEKLEFQISANSQAAKARGLIWGGLGLGFVLAMVTLGPNASLFWSVIPMVVLFLVLDWFVIRPNSKPGQVVITLDGKGLESSRFQTKTKRFAWADLQEVSVKNAQNVRTLELLLKPSLAPDKRFFINGMNHARPAFPLALLEQADQERLFDAVSRKLQRHTQGLDAPAPMPNVLAEERIFQENMVALAPRTWVTVALIGLNVVVWILTVAFGAGISQGSPDVLLVWGGNAASEVQQGQWWRLLTATFLHSGVLHLLFNMVGLWAIGMTVERVYGHRLFVLVYLGAGLAGSAASLHFSAQKAVSVGASGAVFGIAGALLVAFLFHRKHLPQLSRKQTLSGMGVFIMYSLIQGFAKPGIDNAAHVGGLMAGAALAMILPARFDMEYFRKTVRMRTLLALAFSATLVGVLAVTAPRATFDQSEGMEATAALTKGLTSSGKAMQDLQKEMDDVKAGKLSELESDERSRTVHAPRFRLVMQDLAKAKFPATDPRAAFARDYTRFIELVLEGLAMESNIVDGKPVPANPQRSAELEAEIKLLNERIPKELEALKAVQKRNSGTRS